jgi:DNA repair exonuclease SbcCD ATPase subunit
MADKPIQMPKVTPMPPPVARPNRAVHDAYSEEAMRAAQRHIDQIQEIDRLGTELEEWRRRAMLAEAEIKRLEQRNDDLQAMLERQREQLTDERDTYRNRVNSLVSGFHTAGGIILRLLETAQGEVRPSVNLTKLADEIESLPLEGEMPSVVTAGPRTSDG